METVYFGIQSPDNGGLECSVVGVLATQENLAALLMGLGLKSPSEEQTAMVNAIAGTLLEKAQEALANETAEARAWAQARDADLRNSLGYSPFSEDG
jgi:hypothetical protein